MFRSLLGVSLVILAAGSYQSLEIWGDNPWGFPHPERLIPIALVATGFGLLFYAVARRFGADRVASTGGAVVWVLLLTGGGGLLPGWPFWLMILAMAAGSAVITYLLHRLAAIRGREAMIAVLLAFLLSGPLIAATRHMILTPQEFSLDSPTSPVTTTLENTPDIFVVVFDGFIGFQGLEEIFRPQPQWTEALTTAGYEVPESAWASYGISIASIPSLLQMDYPVDETHALEKPGRKALAGVIAGNNRLVSIAEDSGYETVMIEAGWSRSYCGPEIDRCVPSAFVDGATFAVLRHSVIGDWVEETYGSSFTVGALHAMGHLREMGPVYATDDQPTLVFGHIMAPHPPLFLDQDCNYRFEPELNGNTIDVGLGNVEQRKEAFLGQAECAVGFAIELLEALPPETIVVFAADHGSDSHNQLLTLADDWTAAGAVERMNVFLAARTPENCALGSPVQVPNVMRRILACLGDEPAVDVEARMFFGSTRPETGSPILEPADPEVVEALLGLDFTVAEALMGG